MILNGKRTYSILFMMVLLCQLYMPSFRYNIFLQIIVLSFVLFFGKAKVSKSFLDTVFPIFLIVFFGFTATFFNEYGKVEIVKDFTHIVKPALGIAIGYFIFREINDFRTFVKVVVVSGFLCALYHLIKILVFAGQSETVNELRMHGLDNFLELFALFFVFYTPKLFEKPLFTKKIYLFVIKIFLVISCFMYFSRTMFVVAGIIALSIYGYTKFTLRSLKVIGLAVVMVAALYAYLFSVKIDRNGTGLEAFFFKLKNAPTELFQTKIDRENHKDLWDHWRGYEAKRAFALMEKKPYSYVVGTGYGSVVNLKFKAPLGDSKDGMRYISELHNGYVYVFYKTGIVGVLLLMFFLFQLYRFIYKIPDSKQHLFLIKMISSIGLLYIFTTLTITGIYNQSDIIIILLGGLVYFESQRRTENQEKGV